ncbi:MAG: L-fucose:H+ symporter permease [Bacteroidaceae bacterium]|nr:L-fucose:H+ symporter permease [Bacteroidaceae bacterium]
MNKPSLVRTEDGRNYLVPFLLITSLFFIWGFANSTLDVLNKFFQERMEESPTRTALIQAMVYGAYFLMAIPAGIFVRRLGYKRTVMLGLMLFSIGAFLFYPSSVFGLFPMFLLALFVLGCGLTCLETSANPYATVLGALESSARRLNVAQSLNGFGWIGGPIIGLLLFDGNSQISSSGDLSMIAAIYIAIGLVGVVALVIFSRCSLPDIVTEASGEGTGKLLWRNNNFVFGLVALFFYVAAQTALNSFFMNYMTDPRAGMPEGYMSPHTASLCLAFVAMVLFLLGRVIGSWFMKYCSAQLLLLVFALGAMVSMLFVSFSFSEASVVAMYACYFFESIMFPTIFALAIAGIGENTSKASSYLIMCIVGGAISPYLMALVYEQTGSLDIPYAIPLLCFVVIALYALYVLKSKPSSAE